MRPVRPFSLASLSAVGKREPSSLLSATDESPSVPSSQPDPVILADEPSKTQENWWNPVKPLLTTHFGSPNASLLSLGLFFPFTSMRFSPMPLTWAQQNWWNPWKTYLPIFCFTFFPFTIFIRYFFLFDLKTKSVDNLGWFHRVSISIRGILLSGRYFSSCFCIPVEIDRWDDTCRDAVYIYYRHRETDSFLSFFLFRPHTPSSRPFDDETRGKSTLPAYFSTILIPEIPFCRTRFCVCVCVCVSVGLLLEFTGQRESKMPFGLSDPTESDFGWPIKKNGCRRYTGNSGKSN